MKRVLPVTLKYTYCALALLALLPLVNVLRKYKASSTGPEGWYEEPFLFI